MKITTAQATTFKIGNVTVSTQGAEKLEIK